MTQDSVGVQSNPEENSEGTETNQPKTKKEEKYQSAQLLLGIGQSEYEYAFARKTAIETRAGILIPLIIGLLTFLLTNLKLKELIALKIDKTSEIIMLLLYGAFGMVIIAATIVSLLFMIKVFLTYDYHTVDTNQLVAYANQDNDYMASKLLELYAEINEHNTNLDNKKTKFYNIGIISMIILFVGSLCFYTVVQFI